MMQYCSHFVVRTSTCVTACMHMKHLEMDDDQHSILHKLQDDIVIYILCTMYQTYSHFLQLLFS